MSVCRFSEDCDFYIYRTTNNMVAIHVARRGPPDHPVFRGKCNIKPDKDGYVDLPDYPELPRNIIIPIEEVYWFVMKYVDQGYRIPDDKLVCLSGLKSNL